MPVYWICCSRPTRKVMNSFMYDAKLMNLGPPRYYIMPYSRNDLFTGRKELLKFLRERLCDDNPQQYNHRVALYGLGGVGKTQLAIEYVYQYRNDYNPVFWINVADNSALLTGFKEIAR